MAQRRGGFFRRIAGALGGFVEGITERITGREHEPRRGEPGQLPADQAPPSRPDEYEQYERPAPEPAPFFPFEPILPPSMFEPVPTTDEGYISEGDEREELLGNTAQDFMDSYGEDYDGDIEVSFDADFDGVYDGIGERSPSVIFSGQEARDFLSNPSYAAVLDVYSTGSGFTASQWLGGMGSVSNFRITPL